MQVSDFCVWRYITIHNQASRLSHDPIQQEYSNMAESNRLPFERTRKDFELCRPIGHKQSASYVYERSDDKEVDFEPHVLQSCPKQLWTEARAQLVDIARKSPCFVSTNFVFPHGDDICVASQVEDICLIDIINGTLPMTEDHASAILTQVSTP